MTSAPSVEGACPERPPDHRRGKPLPPAALDHASRIIPASWLLWKVTLHPVVQVAGGPSALKGAASRSVGGVRSPRPPFALPAAIVSRVVNPVWPQAAPAFRTARYAWPDGPLAKAPVGGKQAMTVIVWPVCRMGFCDVE